MAVGSIIVDATGAGEVEFTTDVDDRDEDGVGNDDPLLTFAPFGQLIQVSQNGIAILDVTFPTAPSSQACDDDDNDDDDENEGVDRDQGDNSGGAGLDLHALRSRVTRKEPAPSCGPLRGQAAATRLVSGLPPGARAGFR